MRPVSIRPRDDWRGCLGVSFDSRLAPMIPPVVPHPLTAERKVQTNAPDQSFPESSTLPESLSGN